MKARKFLLLLLNSITLLGMLFANYAGSSGKYFKNTVAEISHKHDSLFTPAGYTFSIWAAIFLSIILFAIYQWILFFSGDKNHYIKRTGPWFTLSNIFNAMWIYVWVHDMLGLSVVLIFLLLLSLMLLMFRLRLELEDAPVRTIFLVWWPITIYLGWIMTATIACVAAWLNSFNWHKAFIPENLWTMIMISGAGLLYSVLVVKRNMREAALVGIWSFSGIAIRH
ncbi:MAG: hypothetical protein ABIR19_01565, partial [Ginsengibacter sp.]